MSYTIDIDIDWNMQDDTGMPWTFAKAARHPERIVPGAVVLAGRETSLAVAEVVDLDEDGVVHLRPFDGSVKSNLHRLTDPR